MKCFYHSADLDGHCSGAIVKLKYPECNMIGINYGQELKMETIEEGEAVFMVDFCLQPFDQMEILNQKCHLHWIDHHAKGSLDEAYKRGFLASGGQFIEVGKAGCELTWEYVNPDKPMPHAVFLLGRYDVWDHGCHPHVLAFQYGMRAFEDTSPNNTALWDNILFSDYVGGVVRKGIILLEYEKQQNAKFCRAYAFETELNGLKAICANKGFTNSSLFYTFYKSEDHKLMITFTRLKRPAGKWTVSLYSTHDDVDCGEIAKSFGGGGHKGAAGFQCIDLPFEI